MRNALSQMPVGAKRQCAVGKGYGYAEIRQANVDAVLNRNSVQKLRYEWEHSYRHHQQDIEEALETVQRVKGRRKINVATNPLADNAAQNADVEKQEDSLVRRLHNVPNRHDHHPSGLGNDDHSVA